MVFHTIIRMYRRRTARVFSRSLRALALVTISLVVVGTIAISKYRYPRCDDDEAKAFIEEVVSNSTRTYTLIFVT